MLSRVADSLYWMSRYLERAEHACRLIGVRIDAIPEQSEAQVNRAFRRLLAALHLPVPAVADFSAYSLAARVTTATDNPSSVFSAIQRARDNARQVREQISADMWERLNRQYLSLRALNFDEVWHSAPLEFYARTISDLHQFQGAADSTMRHDEGWHFMRLGRFIERAQALSRLLDVHFGQMPRNVPVDLAGCEPSDWFALLRATSAFEAYCKVHAADMRSEAIAAFLIFDPLFPRTVRYCVDRIAEELGRLGVTADDKRYGRLSRLSGRLKAKLDFGLVEEALEGRDEGYLEDVRQATERIHEGIYDAYIDYGADAVVAA
jgi:uncharacterized alpha-E superfamily protein